MHARSDSSFDAFRFNMVKEKEENKSYFVGVGGEPFHTLA
jgi:hypothetical protein